MQVPGIGAPGESNRVRQIDVPDLQVAHQALPDQNIQAFAVDPSLMVQGLQAGADLAAQFARDEDVAAAKLADARASEEIRNALYNPESGFLATKGGDAVAGYKDINARIDEIIKNTTAGMTPGASARARRSIERRIQQAKGSVDRHTLIERQNLLKEASQARIASAANDAVMAFASEGSVASNLAIGLSEISQRADMEGWSPEKRALEGKRYTSETLRSVALRMAQEDPEAALAFVKRNQSRFTGEDLGYIEETIGKDADVAAGQRMAKEFLGAGAGTPRPSTGAIIRDFVPARKGVDLSNVDKPTLDLFARLQGEMGRKFPIKSAFRSKDYNDAIYKARGKKPTNSQHTHGKALDVDVSALSIAERRKFIEVASSLGFTGIGVYKGQNFIHIDTKEAAPRFWYGSGGKADWAEGVLQRHKIGYYRKGVQQEAPQEAPTEQEATQEAPRSDAASAYERALSITDDEQRNAALNYLDDHFRTQERVSKMARKDAKDALWKHVLEGNDPKAAPVELRHSVGFEVSAAMERYWKIAQTGEKPTTDPEVYRDLMFSAARDQDEFAETDMMLYVDKLSEGDLKRFLDMQAKVIGGEPVKEVAYGPAIQVAATVWESLGIQDGEKGSPQAQRRARLEMDYLERVEQWQASNPGQPMTRSRMMAIADEAAVNSPLWRDGSAVNVGVGGELTVSPSTLRSAAQSVTRAKIGKPSDRVEEYDDFNRAHLEMARLHVQRFGDNPTAAEAEEMARQMLIEVTVNGSGFFDQESKFAYQVDEEDMAEFVQGRLTIEVDGEEISLSEFQRAANRLKSRIGSQPSVFETIAEIVQ